MFKSILTSDKVILQNITQRQSNTLKIEKLN